jgi:3-dehydroquinate synthase
MQVNMKKLENKQTKPSLQKLVFISPISAIQGILNQYNAFSPVFICDANTYIHCYKPYFNTYPVIQIEAGENQKSLDNVTFILSSLLDRQADRSTLLIALGGGMITDITGFVASIYKRGISFISIPTSTLAMADAALGGKTGVNVNGIKNSVGSFYFPLSIIVAPDFLKTLPSAEYNAGWFEIVKILLLFDSKSSQSIMRDKEIPKNEQLVTYLKKSLALKAKVVKKDPFEKGLRSALNYGHTIGHALESYYQLHSLPLLHGEAIAWGMQIENNIALALQIMKEKEVLRINNYLNALLPLPPTLPPLADLLPFILNDKKNKGKTLQMALIQKAGKYQSQVVVPLDILKSVWSEKYGS